MKKKKRSKIHFSFLRSAKECAYLAVFVATVITTQLALSLIPGIELVSLLFISYSFVMGGARGVIAATAFSLLRQLVFGFYPTVLIVYLIYYNLLALCFGYLGKRLKNTKKDLPILLLFSCVATLFFSLLDCLITPLWYHYTAKALIAYCLASLPFALTQTACVAVSVLFLFKPLTKAFAWIKRNLR